VADDFCPRKKRSALSCTSRERALPRRKNAVTTAIKTTYVPLQAFPGGADNNSNSKRFGLWSYPFFSAHKHIGFYSNDQANFHFS
jgi:hypothetical protein